MTTKERIIGYLDRLDEAELMTLGKQLSETALPHDLGSEEKMKGQLAALHAVAGMLSDHEEYVLFEEASRRRSSLNVRSAF